MNTLKELSDLGRIRETEDATLGYGAGSQAEPMRRFLYMKATYIWALAAAVLLPAAGYGQLADQSAYGRRPTAADITRGRLGGDPARSSTGVVISGANANLGAGSYTLMGATPEGTIPLDPGAIDNGLEGSDAAFPVVSPVKRQLPAGRTGVVPRMDEETMNSEGTNEGDMNAERTETQPVFSGASTTEER